MISYHHHQPLPFLRALLFVAIHKTFGVHPFIRTTFPIPIYLYHSQNLTLLFFLLTCTNKTWKCQSRSCFVSCTTAQPKCITYTRCTHYMLSSVCVVYVYNHPCHTLTRPIRTSRIAQGGLHARVYIQERYFCTFFMFWSPRLAFYPCRQNSYRHSFIPCTEIPNLRVSFYTR